MPHRISGFILRHSRLFRQGRLEEMLDNCVFPLALHQPGGLRVVRSRDDYRAQLHDWSQQLRRLGLTPAPERVEAIELPRHDRCRVWVDQPLLDAAQQAHLSISLVFYCRIGPQSLQIEMIELRDHIDRNSPQIDAAPPH